MIQDQTKQGQTVVMKNHGGIAVPDAEAGRPQPGASIPESKASASSLMSKMNNSGLAEAVLDGLLALAATTSTMTSKDSAGGLRKNIEIASKGWKPGRANIHERHESQHQPAAAQGCQEEI